MNSFLGVGHEGLFLTHFLQRTLGIFLYAFLIFALSSCASQQTSRELTEARKAYQEYVGDVSPDFDFEIRPVKEKDAEKLALKKADLREKIAKECLGRFDDKLTGEIQAIEEGGKDAAHHEKNAKRARELPQFADKAYADFEKCAAKLGAKNVVYFVNLKEGQKIPVPEWLREVLKRGGNYVMLESLASSERGQAAGQVGAAILLVGLLAAAAYAADSNAYDSSYAPSLYPGNCYVPSDRAADGSRCGRRAATVRLGGY